MKKEIFVLILAVCLISSISAIACDIKVSLLNQDPYPAIPGEYVKVVFQIDGIANPECNTVNFELLEKYPIKFDPDANSKITIESGTYKKDYSSFLMAPYKVRIDSNALNGNTPIEVQYKYGTNIDYETQQFNLYVEDVRADFEIYVTNYDYTTQEITFEILNIAKSDIDSLTLEIPQQDTIEIMGSETNILGSLDSNEYTTADFKAIPKGGDIKINVSYTDTTNTRRTIEKTVFYNTENFKKPKASIPTTTIIILIIIIGIIFYFFYKRRKKKKRLMQHHQQEHLHKK